MSREQKRYDKQISGKGFCLLPLGEHFREGNSVSRATFERMVAIGLLPKPYQVGKRFVRWRNDEVEAFISTMPRLDDAYTCQLGRKGGAV